MTVQDLPDLNAALNTTATLLLAVGRIAIQRKKVALHKKCMLTAVVVSTLFLISYVIYHRLAGMTHFTGQGFVRGLYFTILWTHTPLAAILPPLVGTTLFFALKGRFERHRRLARITWPIWIYVSVTGVVIWWMLYRGNFGS